MDIWLYGRVGIWLYGCMAKGMYGQMDIHIYIYIYMYIHKCTAVWEDGSMHIYKERKRERDNMYINSIWAHGYMATIAIWPYGHVDMWLCGYMYIYAYMAVRTITTTCGYKDILVYIYGCLYDCMSPNLHIYIYIYIYVYISIQPYPYVRRRASNHISPSPCSHI